MAASSRACFHFKVVLLGNSGVGKSCLVNRFVKDTFSPDIESTIGAAFLTQTIALPTETVKFEIWDTAGQERYRSLAPMYYRGAQAAVVVFSLVDAESFNGAKAWVSELQKHGGSDMIIALAGNKNDLGHVRKVDRDTALEYARANGCFYLETSAKTAAGVQDLFTEVAKRVPKTSAPPRNAEFLDSSEPPSGKCC